MKVNFLFPPIIEDSFCWLLAIDGLKLGVYLEKKWCINFIGKRISIKNSEDMMPLLPILEVGREEFFMNLDRVVIWRSELEYGVRNFPEDLLLRFALESSVSEYWPNKALDWLEAKSTLGVKLNESLKILLGQQWLPQKLRQRAELMSRLSAR